MAYEKFIHEKIEEIRKEVGKEKVINALSGGVDSSVVTILGNKAVKEQLTTFFVENGLMRENEPQQVYDDFMQLGINVRIIDAKDKFFQALKGLEDPEEKRNAITNTFYREVFSEIIKETGAKYLLQGTILTDIEETKAGIKRQHNVFEQIGINPQERFGYKIIEPLKTFRKNDVRGLAKELGLPENRYNRIPFPGPALATRIIGEVTPEKIEIIRKATTIVEEELKDTNAFQYFAVLMKDKVTGIRDNKRDFGNMIVIRCVDSLDARTAEPTKIEWEKLEEITQRLTKEVPGIVRVAYDTTPKPPATIEYI